MTPTLTRLLEAIEGSQRYPYATGSALYIICSHDWDAIIELAAKVRAELNAVPQEDVAGRMERE